MGILYAIDLYKRIVSLPIGKTAYKEIVYREIAYKGNYNPHPRGHNPNLNH